MLSCTATQKQSTDSPVTSPTDTGPDLTGSWYAEVGWLELMEAYGTDKDSLQIYERMNIDTPLTFRLDFDKSGNATLYADQECVSDFIDSSIGQISEFCSTPEFIEERFAMSVEEFESMIAAEAMTLESYGELVAASFSSMVTELCDNASEDFTFSYEDGSIITVPDSVAMTVEGNSITYSSDAMTIALVFTKII